MSFRVPTSTVSVVDFTAVLDREVTKDEINAAMREYAKDSMAGILGYTEEPLVSTDFKGDSRSSIFSAMDTLVDRQPGQGHQLVRQRVRLCLPPVGHHRLRRAPPERLSDGSANGSMLKEIVGDPASLGQAPTPSAAAD